MTTARNFFALTAVYGLQPSQHTVCSFQGGPQGLWRERLEFEEGETVCLKPMRREEPNAACDQSMLFGGER